MPYPRPSASDAPSFGHASSDRGRHATSLLEFDRCDDVDPGEVLGSLVRAGVSIRHGRLKTSAPGAESWIAANERELIVELLAHTDIQGFVYDDYHTGYWPYQGVSLDFVDLHTGEVRYRVFNAVLTRSRASGKHKKGDRLPRGHFTVAKRGGFVKFWKSTGLKEQKLSTYYEHMGNLRGIVFCGIPHRSAPNRLRDVYPLNVGAEEIKAALGVTLADKQPTEHRQATDNRPTTFTDKGTGERQEAPDVAPNPDTGHENYGIRQQGSTDTRVLSQSTEDWLEDYDRRANEAVSPGRADQTSDWN